MGLETNRLIASMVDRDWYAMRYTDVPSTGPEAVAHFLQTGATEQRDPNRFFDSAWYLEQYPDVASSGLYPLLHYLQAGAAERRSPHPRFDARYYVEQHPEAAANPLLYHLRTGLVQGYLTEKPIDIQDYLPSKHPPLDPPIDLFVDVLIPVQENFLSTLRCIQSILLTRGSPMVRIIVIDDAVTERDLSGWLQDLSRTGQIHLIRNRRRLGVARCVAQGVKAAENHDVIVVKPDIEVPDGWLQRLAAHAWSQTAIATVSPFFSGPISPDCSHCSVPTFNLTATRIDEVCRIVNAGRCVTISAPAISCLYIRRAALQAVGPIKSHDDDAMDFCLRATAAGWQHRLACDVVVCRGVDDVSADDLSAASSQPAATADPNRFAVAAAVFRQSIQPVILMVSHNLGGGVRRHIHSLAKRYRGFAHIFLLEGTDHGVSLSVPVEPNLPTLTLPSGRKSDLVRVLQSANLSRVHIHHQMRVGLDLRRLIARLGVPFDVTVHDYFAICPQVNLLRSPGDFYCGEPDVASCNACIADLGSHGAKDITLWRRENAWQFLQADRVICPSGDVMSRLARYGFRDNIIVASHEATTAGYWPIDRSRRFKPPLRIVLLGVLANHKGARTVSAVAEAAAAGTIELHLIGHLEDDFPAPAARLIHISGRYEERDFNTLLSQAEAHVVWLPSSAPETYSYTLSAAIASGLPIVATNLGSFPERLAGRPATWVVDHRATTQQWLAIFSEVRLRLQGKQPPCPVPRAAISGDFYANDYLLADLPEKAPSAHLRHSASKPRIVVVPERLPSGVPTPSAYVRLLLPLDHPLIGGDFDVLLTDPETVFDCAADIIATQGLAIADVPTADRLSAHARRIGAKLVLDLDDDQISRVARPVLRQLMANADAVWLSTQHLADRFSHLRPDAMLIESRLDERIWQCPPAPLPHWDYPIRVLFMATDADDRDLALIEPALIPIPFT